jgi:hemolysin III
MCGFVLAVPLGIVLGLEAEGGRGRIGGAVFAATVVLMFGASALHNCITWSPARRRWTRRLDHAGIFGLIAGTYTPFGLLALRGNWRLAVLAIVWSGAATAILGKLLWTDAPRWLSAAVGIALGWVVVVAFPQLASNVGLAVSLLIVAGGLCYTLGAVIYAIRKPDPLPAVFGYHELFHALVLAAVAFQYTAVALVVV